MTLLRTIQEQAQSLANYLPGGDVFKAKNISTTNLRKFLVGLSGELVTSDGYLRSYSEEIIPDKTVLFINEWEKALGIPDDCFSATGSLNERRTHILIKLASLGVQTSQDFIDLAALFGLVITISSGSSLSIFPFTFPLQFLTAQQTKFTIVVNFNVIVSNTFPQIFPITFGDSIIPILQCLFSKLKPANVSLVFLQT